MAPYAFVLEPIPPFRLDLTVWTLRRRPENVVDRWDGHAYKRVLVLDGQPLEITVTQSGSPDAPRLTVSLSGPGAGPPAEPRIGQSLDRLLGIRIDLGEFYRFAEGNAELKALARQFRGAKPPRFPTGFETLANAITCQQISLNVGIRLLNRLAQAYGLAIQTQDGAFHAFPHPEALAAVDVEDLRRIGFSHQKGNYLLGLARSITAQQLNLKDIASLDDTAAMKRLCQIRGVGRWTAEYFLLRGLGRTHIFPGDDVGAQNYLQRWLGLPGRPDYAAVRQALTGYERFAGLLYFHFLMKSLLDKGILSS